MAKWDATWWQRDREILSSLLCLLCVPPTASHNTGNISSDSKETIDKQPVKILSTQLEFVGERLWVLFTNTKSGFQRERGSRGKRGMWTKRSKLNMKWTKHYQRDKYKYEWIMQSVIYEEMSVVLACNFPRKTCARHQFSPDIDLCLFLRKSPSTSITVTSTSDYLRFGVAILFRFRKYDHNQYNGKFLSPPQSWHQKEELYSSSWLP